MRHLTADVWGAMWQQSNRRDGRQKHLICKDGVPPLFRTRAEAREWIEKSYGCIRTRADLRAEPHGWRMPRAVRVRAAILEARR